MTSASPDHPAVEHPEEEDIKEKETDDAGAVIDDSVAESDPAAEVHGAPSAEGEEDASPVDEKPVLDPTPEEQPGDEAATEDAKDSVSHEVTPGGEKTLADDPTAHDHKAEAPPP